MTSACSPGSLTDVITLDCHYLTPDVIKKHVLAFLLWPLSVCYAFFFYRIIPWLVWKACCYSSVNIVSQPCQPLCVWFEPAAHPQKPVLNASLDSCWFLWGLLGFCPGLSEGPAGCPCAGSVIRTLKSSNVSLSLSVKPCLMLPDDQTSLLCYQ